MSGPLNAFKSLIFVTFFLFSQISMATMIYVPESFKPATARVVVVIHGCVQSPESMALGAGWNEKAEKNNLVILYPKVPNGSNAIDCWGWYQPENQSPNSGQLALIHSEIKSWKKRLGIQKAPVYVTGISSGAATVSGLLACFPNDFTAGAIHSGPSYGLVSNIKDAEEILKNGVSAVPVSRVCNPGNFKKPVMVIHGGEDKVVNPKNVNTIISDFLGYAAAQAIENHEANGLKYTSEDYLYKGKTVGRIVKVQGLGHAWAGFAENLRHAELLGPNSKYPTQIPFFSDKGPSSTNMIFEFFEKAH